MVKAFRSSSSARGSWVELGREALLKIIYTRGQREEPLASLPALKKILARFIGHHVFYEMSARRKHSQQHYSIKNSFSVGDVEVKGAGELVVTIYDANNPAHSIEIINPHAMRVYDDNPGKSFAVAFYADEACDFDVRYYLRDEGEDEKSSKRTALERITLPQLFEYLQNITDRDVVEVTSKT
ncbi:MAG: hypothetical protein GIW99_10605 [Candidatus Eremiobacteraeota bacterium]|nr:hypothetical protein [Candidatus Eremiobacteraeota bacterium]MBC5828112.1 hypothetical protein [Candidatus Eremiobacteraeota bacterium]